MSSPPEAAIPKSIRILGGPILTTQRVKIDVLPDQAFADLFYLIRRQLPKVLSEEQAEGILPITPENYHLVFVNVEEGRAKPLGICEPNSLIRNAVWVCPALLLREKEAPTGVPTMGRRGTTMLARSDSLAAIQAATKMRRHSSQRKSVVFSPSEKSSTQPISHGGDGDEGNVQPPLAEELSDSQSLDDTARSRARRSMRRSSQQQQQAAPTTTTPPSATPEGGASGMWEPQDASSSRTTAGHARRAVSPPSDSNNLSINTPERGTTPSNSMAPLQRLKSTIFDRKPLPNDAPSSTDRPLGDESSVAGASSPPRYANDPQTLKYRERLMAILALYDPPALRRIDRILEKGKGKEEELIALAVLKYGPEPVVSTASIARGDRFASIVKATAAMRRASGGEGGGMAQTLSGSWQMQPEDEGGSSVEDGGGAMRRRSNWNLLRRSKSVIAGGEQQQQQLSFSRNFRELVELVFDTYDRNSATAVGLFLQRAQAHPKALGANLALHMQLYKHLAVDIERAEQLTRRQVERDLFHELHEAHATTRLGMWFHLHCKMERQRFEGMHLLMRAYIPPKYFLEWKYLQRDEHYNREAVTRLNMAQDQQTAFHSIQRLFFWEWEIVQRRLMVVQQRVVSQQVQRLCYMDRERVRREARAKLELDARCVLEQQKLTDMERRSRIAQSMVMLEALDRRCLEFDESSKAFLVPIAAKRFFERSYRQLWELQETEARMRVVYHVSQRRSWILLEQKFLLATEQCARLRLEAERERHMDVTLARCRFGAVELDKRLLMVHFEEGCRQRIVQRRWLGRETVARDAFHRTHLMERWEVERTALQLNETAWAKDIKRLEYHERFNASTRHISRDSEPEGRWFHVFGESATFRHFQRQFLYGVESIRRYELRLFALAKMFWLAESQHRATIELEEQASILHLSSGGKGSMEAVARHVLFLQSMRGLFALFQRELQTRESLLRPRIRNDEQEHWIRIMRRGNSAEEDTGRVTFLRRQELVARETLYRWHYYQQEYFTRTMELYESFFVVAHRVTARTTVRYQERRHWLDLVECTEAASLIRLEETKQRRELQRWYVWSEQTAARAELMRHERDEFRFPIYKREKNSHDFIQRKEMAEEEQERRLYWKTFQVVAWERIPRLHMAWLREVPARQLLERRMLLEEEMIRRRRIDAVEQKRGFDIIEQRRLMDIERIVRRTKIEPSILKSFQGIERMFFEVYEEHIRQLLEMKEDSVVHIFEQRHLQLYYFVVRSHVRSEEFTMRKEIEMYRVIDKEESARSKLRNHAMGTLRKWWQKTNLQGRQDVVAYATRVQREDDNRAARESAARRVEERMQAQLAEKVRATAEAKANQRQHLLIHEELQARGVLWEHERSSRLSFVADYLDLVQSIGQVNPGHVKAKQKLVRALQSLHKSVKAAHSLEQVVSLLPVEFPDGKKRRGSSSSASQRGHDDSLTDQYEESDQEEDDEMDDHSASLPPLRSVPSTTFGAAFPSMVLEPLDDASHHHSNNNNNHSSKKPKDAGTTLGRRVTSGPRSLLPTADEGSLPSASMARRGSSSVRWAGDPQQQANDGSSQDSALLALSPDARAGLSEMREVASTSTSSLKLPPAVGGHSQNGLSASRVSLHFNDTLSSNDDTVLLSSETPVKKRVESQVAPLPQL